MLFLLSLPLSSSPSLSITVHIRLSSPQVGYLRKWGYLSCEFQSCKLPFNLQQCVALRKAFPISWVGLRSFLIENKYTNGTSMHRIILHITVVHITFEHIHNSNIYNAYNSYYPLCQFLQVSNIFPSSFFIILNISLVCIINLWLIPEQLLEYIYILYYMLHI